MKKSISILFPAFVTFFLFSCNSSPEKTFGIAALNCNMLYGFGGSGMQRELASPSVKLVDEKTMASAPMKRAEVIDEKLARIEENYKQIKGLSSNDDSKAMIDASISLYEYVMPVYKNEYKQLAALYDDGAAADKIETMEKSIAAKYEAKFEQLYNKMLETATAYAEKHNIPLRTVNPSPTLN